MLPLTLHPRFALVLLKPRLRRRARSRELRRRWRDGAYEGAAFFVLGAGVRMAFFVLCWFVSSARSAILLRFFCLYFFSFVLDFFLFVVVFCLMESLRAQARRETKTRGNSTMRTARGRRGNGMRRRERRKRL